jgi:hypothetical protein
MQIFILKQFVYCEDTAERISLPELNAGLSNFYSRPVSINESNINDFSGDIEALCFGFNSNDDSNYNEADY